MMGPMFRGTVVQISAYFLIVCLLSITFLVFVNASISFVITDILKSRRHVGDDVGTLGFADELVAMVACPFWGVLSDKIGTRTVVVISYLVIGTSLFLFVHTRHVFPDLLLVRILFSIGGAGASTMVTAILPSLTRRSEAQPVVTGTRSDGANSAISGSGQLFRDRIETALEESQKNRSSPTSGSFRIAGLVGTAAGCGALLAVFGFLRLPPFLQDRHLSAATALRDTFYIVGGVAISAAIVSFLGLRGLGTGPASKQKQSPIPCWQMPYAAVLAAFRNPTIGLAYLGGFVARASSVGISLFIPLWVNSYYIQSGRCRIDDPGQIRNECKDAYTLSSIITGVSQLAALFCAPLFGILSEQLRQHRAPVLLAAGAGVASYVTLALAKDPRVREGSLGPSVLLVAALIGISQVGAIVCSLGLLGHAIATDASFAVAASKDDFSGHEATEGQERQEDEGIDRDHDTAPALSENDSLLDRYENGTRTLKGQVSELDAIQGSIAGMYSFAGGVGILLLTKLGGFLFDEHASAPFWLLAGFNCLLLLGAGTSILASATSRVRKTD